MPRGDGTGPMGMGPMTGRAAGYCAGFTAPGFANPIGGGLGRGRGGFARGGRGGRGQRNRYRATGLYGWQRDPAMAPGFGVDSAGGPTFDESASLKSEAEFLENQLQAIRARIDELEADKDS